MGGKGAFVLGFRQPNYLRLFWSFFKRQSVKRQSCADRISELTSFNVKSDLICVTVCLLTLFLSQGSRQSLRLLCHFAISSVLILLNESVISTNTRFCVRHWFFAGFKTNRLYQNDSGSRAVRSRCL